MVRCVLAFVATFLAAAAQAASPATPAPPPPVEDYGRLPAMQMVTLSPSGQRYAFVASVGGTRKLFVATTANQPIESDDLGALKVENVEWAGDDHLLVHMSQTAVLSPEFTENKSELEGVTVVDVKHHKSFSVFGGAYEKRMAHTVERTYGVAQVDGRWFGFFGGYPYEYDKGGGDFQKDANGRLYPSLYKVDLDTGETTLAAKGQEDISAWLVDTSGEVAARLRYNYTNGQWRVMSSKLGGVELASGTSSTDRVNFAGFGRNPGTFLLQTVEGDRDVMRELPLKGGDPIVNPDSDTAGEVLTDPTTQLWIGIRSSDNDTPPKLFAADLQAKLTGAFRAFPNYVVRLISYSADFNRMIVFTDGGDDSGTYWIVDIVKRSADVLGGEYPTVPSGFVGPVRWVDYKAADGLAMRGVLTLPPGRAAKNLPLVVMPHGGPEAHDSLGFDYWAQAFAARGYAVFQPNFRGSDGSGKAFRDAGLGQWGRRMQTDVSDGVAELVRQGLVDPKRACTVGASYGGYAALAGVTLQHGLYRCAVSYGGVSDPAGLLADSGRNAGGNGPTTRYWKEFMGVNNGQTDLAQISPLHLADRADAPILLIHGADDTVVPIDQSQAMQRALRRAGKPVELITLPGADHWLLEEPARIAMLKASVEFVLKNNPPDPPPTALAAAH